MTSRPLLLAASLLVAGTTGAWAQSNPSADSIINSLRPGGGMMGGTRGIRPVSPGPTAPDPAMRPAATGRPAMGHTASAPSTAAAPSAPATTAPPSVNLTVQFASNSADLTPAAVHTLTELGRALSSASLSGYRFRIEGHTDTVGTPEANKSLSDRRAQAVVAFLSQRFKIDAARLDAVGMGEDGLLVQTPTGTAEPRNRRVQVINLGA